MFMAIDMLNDELQSRSAELNDNPIYYDGQYVLVWLQQTLRGDNHPAIDAGVEIANRLELPVLVYHGLREDYPHASDRLHHFIIGASREMAKQLTKRGIAVAQHVVRADNEIRGLVYQLADKAALVITDRHATFVANVQANSFAKKSKRGVIAVDSTRLVPQNLLPSGLTATKAFRAAHTELRGGCLADRKQIEPTQPEYTGPLPFEPDKLSDYSDDDISALIANCRIDHSLPPSSEYPPTRSAVEYRLNMLIDRVIGRYKWSRNNPADDTSCSSLSPYLHFGMTSPFEIMGRLNAAEIPASVRYKFCDELLTWREWCHWRMVVKPNLTHYESLPSSARKNMEAHASDDRAPLLSLHDLVHGNTPDETWNAAQRQWLKTGWMHNNLRMYWSQQILAWTPSPQAAWATACYLNDRLSLDGRDPATYVMMRSAFGEARPAYQERPIYSWVSRKTDHPLRKRAGVNEWLAEMANIEVPHIDVPDDYSIILDHYV